MNTAHAQEFIARALTFLKNKQYDIGILELIKLLKNNPNHPEALRIIVYTCSALPNKRQSLEILKKCIEEGIHSPILLYELGSLHLSLGEYPQAVFALQQVLKQHPNNFEALHDLGAALALMGKKKEARDRFLEASEINGQSAELFYNLGRLFDEDFNFNQAISFYQKAIKLHHGFTAAWINLAINFGIFKKYEDALRCFEIAYAQNPSIDFLYGDCLFIKMRMCQWEEEEKIRDTLYSAITKDKNFIAPFPLMALIDSPALIQKASILYAKCKYPENTALGPAQHRINQKIRIGYFSPDFHEHPVSYLTAEIFELHDRNEFEVYAFSFGKPCNDEMRNRLKESFDDFIDVADKTPTEIALLSREIGIDIGIDLCGFTENARTEIFALRAAPIQISYIGYLGTIGANYIDYLIADKTIIPKNLREFYSEKIIYLPNYQSNDSKRLASNRIYSKQDLGIQEDRFVFCNLNNVYKITPSIFEAWLTILDCTPNSVLLLYSENIWAADNLKRYAIEKGLSADRLIFFKHVPRADYLAQYAIADLFLDTYPYNAGTTASDALWMGVPVITLQGQSFPSRVASSLLINLDLPELIHQSLSAYQSQAIELATNPKKLKLLKQKLFNNRKVMPLFDTRTFTRNLEKAITKVYQRSLDMLPPEDIDLVPID